MTRSLARPKISTVWLLFGACAFGFVLGLVLLVAHSRPAAALEIPKIDAPEVDVAGVVRDPVGTVTEVVPKVPLPEAAARKAETPGPAAETPPAPLPAVKSRRPCGRTSSSRTSRRRRFAAAGRTSDGRSEPARAGRREPRDAADGAAARDRSRPLDLGQLDPRGPGTARDVAERRPRVDRPRPRWRVAGDRASPRRPRRVVRRPRGSPFARNRDPADRRRSVRPLCTSPPLISAGRRDVFRPRRTRRTR